jgi:hypothetical protein
LLAAALVFLLPKRLDTVADKDWANDNKKKDDVVDDEDATFAARPWCLRVLTVLAIIWLPLAVKAA